MKKLTEKERAFAKALTKLIEENKPGPLKRLYMRMSRGLTYEERLSHVNRTLMWPLPHAAALNAVDFLGLDKDEVRSVYMLIFGECPYVAMNRPPSF